MRIDTATEILGIRVNIWLSIIGIGGALIAVVARGLWRRPDDSDEPYTDGHRWSDPRDEAAEADAAADRRRPADADDRRRRATRRRDDRGRRRRRSTTGPRSATSQRRARHRAEVPRQLGVHAVGQPVEVADALGACAPAG